MLGLCSAFPARAALLLAAALFVGDSLGQTPTVEQKERLAERDRFWKEAQRLRGQGKLAESIEAAEKVLALERRLMGSDHPEVAATLEFVGEVQVLREDFGAARKAYQEALVVYEKHHGSRNWRTTEPRLKVAHVERLASLSREQRQRLDQVGRLGVQGQQLLTRGRYEEALPVVREVLEARTALLGKDHPETLLALNNLAVVYMGLRDHVRAEVLLARGLAIRRRVYGDQDPTVAQTLGNLGMAHLERGDPDRAEPLLRQAVDVLRETKGEAAPEYATAIGNLGELHRRRDEQAKAAPLLIKAAGIFKAAGRSHRAAYASAVNNVALLGMAQGDLTSAEQLFHEALENLEAAVGTKHPNYRSTLASLAELYERYAQKQEQEENWKLARKAREQVVTIRAEVHGRLHWRTAEAREALAHLERLARLDRDQRRQFAAAEKRLAEARQRGAGGRADALDAVAELEKLAASLFGKESATHARAAHRLGALCLDQGDLKRAEALLRQALELYEKILGEKHPRHAEALDDLVALYRRTAEGAKPGDGEWRRALREAAALLARRYGEKDWRVAEVKENLIELEAKVRLDADQSQRLTEANRLLLEALRLLGQGKPAEALARAERAAAIREELYKGVPVLQANTLSLLGNFCLEAGFPDRAEPLLRRCLARRQEIWGEAHPDGVRTLTQLAVCRGRQGDHREAEELLRKALRLAGRVWGESDPQYAQTLLQLGGFYQEQMAFAEAGAALHQAVALLERAPGRKGAEYATALRLLAGTYAGRGAPEQAAELLSRALDLPGPLDPEDPRHNATLRWHLLHDLGLAQIALADPVRAEPLLSEALALATKLWGEQAPRFAASLVALSQVERLRGRYDRALDRLRRAQGITEAQGKVEERAVLRNNLGDVYHHQGDYAQAERAMREAVRLRETSGTDRLPSQAVTLNNLGQLYNDMGDYAEAVRVLRKAAEVWKKAVGEEHPYYANMLNNLGMACANQGEAAEGRRYLERAKEIRAEVLGTAHRDYVQSLANLGVAHYRAGEHVRAEALYQEALAFQERVLSRTHPDTVRTRHNLGTLCIALRRFSEAERYLQEAVDEWKQSLGERHPNYAYALNRLGRLEQARGEPAKAALHYRRALDAIRPLLEQTFSVQSERQQLLTAEQFRFLLHDYLAATGNADAAAAYELVLAWKGIVFARQRWLRLARGASDPVLSALLRELEHVSSELVARTFRPPAPDRQAAWREELDRLARRREKLERDLLERSPEYRGQQQNLCRTAEDLRTRLPRGAALVDFVEYTPPTAEEPRLTAFVIHPDRPGVQRIDLGAVQALADLADRWRRSYGSGRRPSAGQPDPGVQLRRRVWEPLEPWLRGVKTVLLSPDGALARFPFGALPGTRPETYLIEDVAVAVLPVPQLLPEVLAPLKGDAAPLLLVGDVNFGTRPADATPAGRVPGLPTFAVLPGTKDEVKTIEGVFASRHPGALVGLLTGAEATKAAFLREAPRHRFLHLATHGFFAAESARPAGAGQRGADLDLPTGQVVGWHPGLLSALAFAGANQPPAEGAPDGILTALEVAETDLRGVGLVVLSACETGLGKSARGESMLGLQRAFQVAGARSVVASLWQVPDLATAELMKRFYQNLRPAEPLGKLEALRQAQLWMLREGSRSDPVRRSFEREAKTDFSEKGAPLSPYCWAGFVLSGDWR